MMMLICIFDVLIVRYLVMLYIKFIDLLKLVFLIFLEWFIIYIYDVIDYVKDNFFMFVKGGRSGVNWMVVIFMDGFLNNYI